jgi:HEAT repeat protein
MNPRFLLFRLRHAQGTDFYPVLDEILSHADALDEDSVSELTALVEQKISAGWRTPGTPLAKLARFTKSELLSTECRRRLLKDELGAGDLMPLVECVCETGTFGHEVEEQLLSRLYTIRLKDDDPRRSELVRALGSRGSESALAVLHGILAELEPTGSVRELFADALQTPSLSEDYEGTLLGSLAALRLRAGPSSCRN